MLKIFETHPVQYHAPVYRCANLEFGVPLKVYYGGDFSVRGYQDQEFGAAVKWDIDLVGGYDHEFLCHTSPRHPENYFEVRGEGIAQALHESATGAVLALGYNSVFDRAVWRAVLPTRIPLLLRAEANDQELRRTWTKGLARDAALRLAYRRVDAALYIGQQAKLHYLRLGIKPANLEFSPYCVDLSHAELDPESIFKSRQALRATLQLTDSDQLALFSGKLSIRKGMREWLAACLQLPESARKRLVLGFVGAGELESELRAGLAVPGAPRAHFFGFKNQTELSAIYAASDFGVLPSVSGETWGLVVNESLHHGRPVLVSDRIGSARDLIVDGQTGMSVPPSSEALMQACLYMMELTQDVNTFARCRAAVTNYNIRAAAAGIARAYALFSTPGSKAPTRLFLPPTQVLPLPSKDTTVFGGIAVAGLFKGNGVAGSLARGLEAAGLVTTRVDFSCAYRKGLRQSLHYRWNRQPLDLEKFSQTLRMHCLEHDIRVLLCTGIFPMTASVAQQLRDSGVKIINFLTDDPWNLVFTNNFFLPCLPFFHTIFTPRRANFQQLIDAGAPRVRYLPFGFDESFFFANSQVVESELDLLFVGACDADRADLLKPIAESGLKIALYGSYWNRHACFRPFARGVTDPQTLQVQTSAAKVCLILVRRANRDEHVMRSFEAAACGACLLVERTADHEAIFGPDGEAVRYFNSDAEILPKLRELLSDAPLRMRLRQAVIQRAQGQGYRERVLTMLAAAASE